MAFPASALRQVPSSFSLIDALTRMHLVHQHLETGNRTLIQFRICCRPCTSPELLSIQDYLRPNNERKHQRQNANDGPSRQGSKTQEGECADEADRNPFQQPGQNFALTMRTSLFSTRAGHLGRSSSISMRMYRVNGRPCAAALAFTASRRASGNRMFSTADLGSNSKLVRSVRRRRPRLTEGRVAFPASELSDFNFSPCCGTDGFSHRHDKIFCCAPNPEVRMTFCIYKCNVKLTEMRSHFRDETLRVLP